MKNLATTSENFVTISLVAYVPNELIVRSIEHIMQGNGKLHDTQDGGKVATMHTDTINDKLTQFITDLLQLGFIQFLQVGRGINQAQKRSGSYLLHSVMVKQNRSKLIKDC